MANPSREGLTASEDMGRGDRSKFTAPSSRPGPPAGRAGVSPTSPPGKGRGGPHAAVSKDGENPTQGT